MILMFGNIFPQLVCECVAIGCRRLLRGEYGSLLPSLFGCHVAYSSQTARFKNVSHIVCVWTDCSEQVVAFQQKEANNILVTDEEIVSKIIVNVYFFSRKLD